MDLILGHVLIIFVIVFLLHFVHYSWDFTFLLFIANGFTDVLKVLAFFLIDAYAGSLGFTTRALTAVWISLGALIVITGFYAYYTRVIKKKRFSETSFLYVLLLISFVLHAVMDIALLDKARL